MWDGSLIFKNVVLFKQEVIKQHSKLEYVKTNGKSDFIIQIS